MQLNENEIGLDFEKRKFRYQRLLRSAETALNEAKRRLAEFRETEAEHNPYIFQMQLAKEEGTVRTLDHSIQNLRIQLKMMREQTSQDKEYRVKLLDEFAERIKRLKNPPENLRFHSAPIIPSLEIIGNKALQSTEERGLARRSFDVAGQISVTDYESIQLSLRDYTGCQDQLMPLGCTFVVTPENEQDAASIQSYLMRSMQLQQDGQPSKRFVAVLTSPENLELVQKTLQKNGFPPELAVEYFDYLADLEKTQK